MVKGRKIKELRDKLMVGKSIDNKDVKFDADFDQVPHLAILYKPEEHCSGYDREALEEYGDLYACKLKVIEVTSDKATVVFYDSHHHRIWYDVLNIDDWLVESNVLKKKS